MQHQKVIDHIVNWLGEYALRSGTGGFVIGISGGIDSAVTSTLCALTGKKVMALNMPIHQHQAEFDRSTEHIRWLQNKFPNVESQTVELTPVLSAFETCLPAGIQDFLTMANTRSRIRMTTLYSFACHHKLLVAGTGNKIEDFGIGFFTKYGDGGVDLSPIADLTKSEVYALGETLGLVESIRKARPTDGLFHDGRTDEDQIGASYPELEWAMEYTNSGSKRELNAREQEVLSIYLSRHRANRHKMEPVPVCLIPQELK